MKPAFLCFCLLFSAIVHAQNPLQGLPCASKALLLNDQDIASMSMTQVEAAMCDCLPFARGTDVIVYLDYNEKVNATTVFSFQHVGCTGMTMRLFYSVSDEADTLSAYIADSYRQYDTAYRPFKLYDQMHRNVKVWLSPTSYLQMSTEHRHEKQMVELIKTYMARK